ncbi:MAG: nitrate reductase associated protein [Deltaproteobacteria bacterium]|nr:nitrate reductase associated protein [Deltaproteobacteria bacterium]
MDEDDLTLMPRSVRDKLDRVGIKLHLKEWTMLSLAERRALIDAPCDAPADVARYAAELDALVRVRCGKAPDRLPAREHS